MLALGILDLAFRDFDAGNFCPFRILTFWDFHVRNFCPFGILIFGILNFYIRAFDNLVFGILVFRIYTGTFVIKIDNYSFAASPFQVGFLPQMGPPQGAPMPGPPLMEAPQQPPPMQPPVEDEPPSKKSRTEDHLIPEAQFLQRHKGPITIQVQVPSMTEKSEWRLNGQTVSITLALTDTIAAMKGKLQDETGMPPAKQKISYEGMFFKDSNSLAYYNLLSGATVLLALKERGGRKK